VLEGRDALGRGDPQARARESDTILLVENDPALRRSARKLLELEGFRVLEAASRADAVAVCAGRSTQIHLLVTDVMAPSLGRELAGQVMRLHPELRGLLMLRLRSAQAPNRVFFPTEH
jgi:CheY-like chemotaxis protein